MKHKAGLIHSIEAQIYIASKRAKVEGKTKLILGEIVDIICGGVNGLIAKDWLIDGYTYRQAQSGVPKTAQTIGMPGTEIFTVT